MFGRWFWMITIVLLPNCVNDWEVSLHDSNVQNVAKAKFSSKKWNVENEKLINNLKIYINEDLMFKLLVLNRMAVGDLAQIWHSMSIMG